MTDPIADLITRIRNAYLAKLSGTEAPASKLKLEVLRVLKDHGFIADFSKSDDRTISIDLIANPVRTFEFKRVSKPGQRVYKGGSEMSKVRSGLGIAVVSTSQGVMTGAEASKKNIGGEVLVEVW